MNLSMSITGISETLKKMAEMNSKLEKKIVTSAIKAGFKVEADAKYYCPVDTGRLRSSISTNWNGSGMGEGKIQAKAEAGDGIKQPPTEGDAIITVVVGTNVKYARAVEMGTSRMKRVPYLSQAYYQNIGYIKEHVKNAVIEGIK